MMSVLSVSSGGPSRPTQGLTLALIANQSNKVGDSVSVPLSTTGAQGTVTFTADDLPPGLVLDSANAQITGTIDASANTTTPYATLVTANDGVTSTQQTISWSVSAEQLTLDVGDQSNMVGEQREACR